MKNFGISLLQWFPLFVFVMYTRLYDMTDELWKQDFYISSVCAIAVTAFCLYKNIILDRFRLGISLFLTVGAFSFLIGTLPILEFYNAHKGVVFFAGICVIGLFTTLFSPLGFIGVPAQDKMRSKKMSLLLLGATFFALLWSFFMDSYGGLISIVVPFIVLRFLRKRLIDQLVYGDTGVSNVSIEK